MTEVNQNVIMWAGDTKQILVVILDASDIPINLVPGTLIRWVLTYGATISTPQIDKSIGTGITITNAVAGLFRIDLEPEDTLDLTPRVYYHEVEITDVAGNISTALIGTFTIKPTATRPAAS